MLYQIALENNIRRPIISHNYKWVLMHPENNKNELFKKENNQKPKTKPKISLTLDCQIGDICTKDNKAY